MKKERIEIVFQDRSGHFVRTRILKTRKSRRGLKLLICEELPVKPLPNMSPLEIAEKRVIEDGLRRFYGNKNRTRLALRITINTLNAKIKKYGIDFRKYVKA